MAPTASGFRKHAGRKNQQVNENIFFNPQRRVKRELFVFGVVLLLCGGGGGGARKCEDFGH